MLPLHDLIYQKSNGWVGHSCRGCAESVAAHRRRQIRLARISTLTYARDGDAYLIVGSNAGTSRNPAWYHNLRKNPSARSTSAQAIGVTARLIPEDADYQRLWQLANKNNANRTAYQPTSRPLPIFA